MEKLQRIEIEYSESGNRTRCTKFKVNGKSYGTGIYSININIEPFNNVVKIYGDKKIIQKNSDSDIYDIKNVEMYWRDK